MCGLDGRIVRSSSRLREFMKTESAGLVEPRIRAPAGWRVEAERESSEEDVLTKKTGFLRQ